MLRGAIRVFRRLQWHRHPLLTINPAAVYTGDSALSACAVSLAPDTVNGGIAVTATGLAGVTLHWSLQASPLEVV